MKDNYKENNGSAKYLFSKSANKVPIFLLIAFLAIMVFIVYLFGYWFSPKNLEVGYEPIQPIPYSHRLHVGELGLDCRYCHTQVDKGMSATIPSAQLCMNCHDQVKTDSPYIKKVKESYESGKPIEWVKVHNLPDYVYFDHSRHVNSGVSCVSCHGRVDKMEIVRQVKPLSMAWCLECHRNPAPNIRYKDKVVDLGWSSSGDPVELGRKLIKEYGISPREDCNTCHR